MKMKEELLEILYKAYTIPLPDSTDLRILNENLFKHISDKIYEIGFLEGKKQGLLECKELLNG